jgi:2-dehydropantoate 2-reductase
VTRFVVYGAGAVGGVIGARLFEHGHEVLLIARGEHRERIASAGLRLEAPDGVLVQRIPVFEGPEQIVWQPDDVVLVTVKGNDTLAALERLGAAAGPDVAIACVQNGVENERVALRRFAEVYSVVVQLPSTHLEPGVVIAHGAPLSGSLDIGRYPDGPPGRAVEIAAALERSGFASRALSDVSRWKYAKFLRNVHNAVEALFGPGETAPEVSRRAAAEARAALAAAGMEHVGDEEYQERFDRLISNLPVAGRPRGGGSTWQSLARRAGTVEVDMLNGEVVLLGRLHGVPTPVNELLRRLTVADAVTGTPPGAHAQSAFLELLGES